MDAPEQEEWKKREVAYLAGKALCSGSQWAQGISGKQMMEGLRQSLFRALDREASGK